MHALRRQRIPRLTFRFFATSFVTRDRRRLPLLFGVSTKKNDEERRPPSALRGTRGSAKEKRCALHSRVVAQTRKKNFLIILGSGIVSLCATFSRPLKNAAQHTPYLSSSFFFLPQPWSAARLDVRVNNVESRVCFANGSSERQPGSRCSFRRARNAKAGMQSKWKHTTP